MRGRVGAHTSVEEALTMKEDAEWRRKRSRTLVATMPESSIIFKKKKQHFNLVVFVKVGRKGHN